MNRRDFVTQVSVCAAAAYASAASPAASTRRAGGGLHVRFVGMMGFVERTDGSFLVATPGNGGRHHVSHQPFLMARAGSRVARALGLAPAHGVVPESFDMTLVGEDPAGFVYRCLDHTSLDIVSGGTTRVSNAATQMAQFSSIVPGARVRGNIEQWASSRVSLRGGAIEDSAAHPDAGRLWSFGSYRQRLTDAVTYRASASSEVRLTSAADARSVSVGADEHEDLWVISAAAATAVNTPTRLEHSEVAFEFLSEATPIIAECADALGREVPPTEFPCAHPASASLGGLAAARRWPPYTDLCYVIIILTGSQ